MGTLLEEYGGFMVSMIAFLGVVWVFSAFHHGYRNATSIFIANITGASGKYEAVAER